MIDSKLKFNLQVDAAVKKHKCVVGFVKRWLKRFKYLHVSIPRYIGRFLSIVEAPINGCYSGSLESVQRMFLMLALRGLTLDPRVSLSLDEYWLKVIDLPSLVRRREMLFVLFIVKVQRGDIYSLTLIEYVFFTISSKVSRHYLPIKLSQLRTNYQLYKPFGVLCRLYNGYYCLFGPSVYSLNYIGEIISRQ